MQDAAKTFVYTARRTPFFIMVGSFGFLFVVESALIALLVAVLVHDRTIALVINSGHTLLCLLVIGRLFYPLWTRHRLTETHLHLRFGTLLNVQIPRDAIRTVEAINGLEAASQPVLPRYDAKKRRIIVCFSDRGQILLRLHRPLQLKFGKLKTVSSVLFNVDQREEFMALLTPVGSSELDVSTSVQDRVALEELGMSVPSKSLQGAFSSQPMPAMDGFALRIEGVTRRFADLLAVNNLQMSIAHGEIYGFLGSNGAGKSTTIKMLVGLLQPDAGQIEIMGFDMWREPEKAKAELGYVADRALLYERLTGREFLHFIAQMRKIPKEMADERIEQWLDFMELNEHADRICGTYSFGMKRKLSLAGALLHKPRVLVLDEPLNGLDPRSARRLKDLFGELAAQGCTILLSTHDLATAETVCNRVGIFHKGQLQAEGSAAELRQMSAAPDLETVFLSLTSEVATASVEQEVV